MTRRSIRLVDPRTLLRANVWDDFMNDGLSTFAVSQYGLDMYETDHEIVVELEAPKFKPEQVDISVEDKTLTISGHFKQEKEEDKPERKYHYQETTQQSFVRTVTLPVTVKANEAEAEFNDGVIKITLPKAEESKPQKIAVKTKSGSEGKRSSEDFKSASQE